MKRKILILAASLVWAIGAVPIGCLAFGAPPYGAGNVVGFVIAYLTMNGWRRTLGVKTRVPAKAFDVAAARRESHAAGLPFVEADGTVSWPPRPKDVQAHEQIHARRLLAQPEVTGPVGWHVEDCRCRRIRGDRSGGILDSRCRALRNR